MVQVFERNFKALLRDVKKSAFVSKFLRVALEKKKGHSKSCRTAMSLVKKTVVLHSRDVSISAAEVFRFTIISRLIADADSVTRGVHVTLKK
jgi:hypothetical protein